MNQEYVTCRKQGHSVDDRMLLSPTEALTTMALVPIAVFVLVLLAISVPLQHSFGSNRTLDFSLFPDGSTHVFYEIESNPLYPDTQVMLFGDSIENLVVEDENGFLLTTEKLDDNSNIFETAGKYCNGFFEHVFIRIWGIALARIVCLSALVDGV